MKTKFFMGILLMTVTVIGLVFALPSFPTNRGIDEANEKSPAIENNSVIAPPPQLPENELNKVLFIRYKPGFERERPCDNDGICDADEKGWCGDCKGGEEPDPTPTTSCYGFLSGAKPRWKWVENYYYSNVELGNSSYSAVSTWESATTGDIFGQGLFGTYPWGTYDLINSISYGNYDDTGECLTEEPCVIGVTLIWYQGNRIYEYDIMYDTDFFPGDGSFDLDTVVLHEMGHGAGLDDLYDVACIDEVMYGIYQGPKLGLGAGDITGIQTLYG